MARRTRCSAVPSTRSRTANRSWRSCPPAIPSAGLFILDEPEAALSFSSCLQLMVLMDSLVADGSQFLLATHSPLLAAFPGATILELDERGRSVTAWDDLQWWVIGADS